MDKALDTIVGDKKFGNNRRTVRDIINDANTDDKTREAALRFVKNKVANGDGAIKWDTKPSFTALTASENRRLQQTNRKGE